MFGVRVSDDQRSDGDVRLLGANFPLKLWRADTKDEQD